MVEEGKVGILVLREKGCQEVKCRFCITRIYAYIAYCGKAVKNRQYYLEVNIGMQIRFYRKKTGLSQESLATKIGVRQYTIARWERGTTSPTPEQLAQVAKAMGVAIADIYGTNEKATTVIARAPMNKRSGILQEIFEALPPAKQREVLNHAKALKGKDN
jgi:transcriptional regulator with XRE-family HTH domain